MERQRVKGMQKERRDDGKGLKVCQERRWARCTKMVTDYTAFERGKEKCETTALYTLPSTRRIDSKRPNRYWSQAGSRM